MAGTKKSTLKTFSSRYSDFVSKYPMIANQIQGALITAAGVLVSQVVSSGGGLKFDWVEVRVMALIVAFFNTPILMWFLKFLSNSKYSTPVQLLIDQFVFSPPFTFGILFWRYYLLGLTPTLLIPFQVIAILPTTMMYAWCFWIPARYFILVYVPSNQQLLTINICAFIWNVIFPLILK